MLVYIIQHKFKKKYRNCCRCKRQQCAGRYYHKTKGSNKAIISNDKGAFELSVPQNATLTFSGIGFKQKEITIGNNDVYNIFLEPVSATLPDVVITGYSVQNNKPDKNPYLGSAEFYNNFCNFKAAVTVPKNYLVWATGDFKNCNEVVNEKYCKCLLQAETSDAVTTIIDSSDLSKNNITANNSTNTFLYEANNVTDMVFEVSNHYMWQSSSLVVDKSTGRRTRVNAIFNTAHKDYFHVINYARITVEKMSFDLPAWPYPYPHKTVFDGLDEMDYPMMVNDTPEGESADGIELTDDEIFHTMFPFYIGINETKYGWMDEGWATLGEWLI